MHAEIADPLIGRLIDRRYQVQSRIARGGMATVYEADDLRLERRVAVKVMHAHLADDEDFRERFIQEAKQAARLAHPNVVNVFDQGEDSGFAYLVMEHLPSITLRDLLLERGAVQPDDALDVIEAVLAGLSSAHRAGIVHRDIKPENILLAHDGRIKIGDFGLARAASANTATGKALLGTIAYLSPELVTRGIADMRSDIYAVGIMLFEMLTGKQPFTGEQPMQIAYQHAHGEMPLPSALRPGVPRALDMLVQWSTQRDPNLRPSDAAEMLSEVARIRKDGLGSSVTRVLPTPERDQQATSAVTTAIRPLRTADVPAFGRESSRSTPTAVLARKAEHRRRRGWIWLALVVVLAIAAAVTGWWWSAGPGGMTTVPAIAAGMSEAQATQLLTDSGLVVTDGPDEYSADVAAGSVIRSTPESGSVIARGTDVALVLSLGIEMLPPPAIVGVGRADAAGVITAAGFSAAPEVLEFHDAAADTTVTGRALVDGQALDISSQETWPRGVEIQPVVSVGPIPNLAGLSRGDAEARIQALGLTVSVVEEASMEVAEGVVIASSFPDGAQPGSGATVTVSVSTGPPPVTIPDVLGMTVVNAQAALEEAGLVVVVQSNVQPPALLAILQPTGIDPGVGAVVDRGSTVTLTANYG